MAADESGLGSEHGAARPKSDRSMAGLLADLADQISSLFRQEVALLKAELLEKLGLIGQGVGAVAIGALILFSGWLALLAAAVLGLAVVVAPWLPALIAGLVGLGLCAAPLYFGQRRLGPRPPAPLRAL